MGRKVRFRKVGEFTGARLRDKVFRLERTVACLRRGLKTAKAVGQLRDAQEQAFASTLLAAVRREGPFTAWARWAKNPPPFVQL